MAFLTFNKDKIKDFEEFKKLCPFSAITEENGKITATSACKMCKICIKKGPEGAAVLVEDEVKTVDKSLWKNICVYVEHNEGEIHPVTYELIGKARTLAEKIGQEVICLFIGSDIEKSAKELLHYGVSKVFVYDNPGLLRYVTESYTKVFEDFINENKPGSILVGATSVGRQLAPRVAARFKTGLTADCTVLDIEENSDLVQIRPAFGGNIMAEIHTPNNRPQIATVRYKVMNAPERTKEEKGEIIVKKVDKESLVSGIKIIDVKKKEKAKGIENADIIVAVGRGVKSKEDIGIIRELADALGASLASSRPLVEAGWMEASSQIGLSGRTVRPKLIITCGISGAVQFAAGMNNSDVIFAINKDEKAPIFKVADYGIVGDLYKIVPALTKMIKEGK